MKTQSIDTNPKIERLIISLSKKKSTAKKFSQIRSITQTTMQLSKRAISRVNKNFDEYQINLLFINLHYGKDLAERVKKYLDKFYYENT